MLLPTSERIGDNGRRDFQSLQLGKSRTILAMTDSAQPTKSSLSEGWIHWLALGAFILLLGMLLGASLLLYTAYSVIAVVVVSRLLSKAWSTAPTACRHKGPLETEVGQTIPIQVDLTNSGRILIPWLLAEDLLPRSAVGGPNPSLEIDGDRIQVISLGAGATSQLSYNVRCNRRGYYQIGPTVLETGDLMGLNRRYRVGAEPQYLLVMPKVVPLAGYDIQSRRPHWRNSNVTPTDG